MAKNNKIVEEQIIDKEVYQIGQKFSKSLAPATDAVELLEKQWIESINKIKQSAVSYLAVSKELGSVKTNASFIAAKQKEITLTEQTIVAYKEQNAVEKNLINTIERKKIATESTARALAGERLELQILNRNAKEAATLSSKLSTEYEKQNIRLTQLRRSYKDVALTEGEASTKAKALRIEILKLDSSLKKVDANVGQFQRSVGNYGKAMQSAGAAARSMMSAMGVIGGAYLFVNVMKDAFTRVREFDKSMQNLAGVLQVSRKDLANVESEIIRVAGASIKTSREVANLAESLATLGKSPDEIIKLLGAANDLGIGLETTGEEAGEFLVQMLNAFGGTDAEARKYARTIAAIRTSTTLDFQKMRDSFQYIAPISKILNKDLAYTGAVVGVLADNSLKAESAGRLLSTAQQKLSKDGLSLQDALDKINDAKKQGIKETELLKIASNLFGAQAAKVGIILAENSDVIDTNAEAIRNNREALSGLISEQLESLDAKLKLLDSSWEKFILSIEKGDGVISSSFKNVLGFITGAVEGLTILNQSTEEYNASVENRIIAEKYEEEQLLYEQMGESAKRVALQRADSSRDEIDNINAEIKALEDRNKAIDSAAGVGVGDVMFDNPEIARNEEAISALIIKRGIYKGVLKASEELIEEDVIIRKDSNKAIEETVELTDKEIKAKEKSNKALEARLKLLANDKFNLAKARLQSEMQINSEILEDDEQTDSERQIAALRFFEAKSRLLKIQRQKDIDENQGRVDKLAEIELKYNDANLELATEKQEKHLALLKSNFQNEIKIIQEAEQAKIDAQNAEIGAAQSTLSSSAQTPADVEAYESAIYQIKRKYALLEVAVQIDKVKQLQQDKNFTVKQQAELSKQLSDLEIEYSNIATDQILEGNEKQIESEEAKHEQLSDLRRRAFDNLTVGLAESLGIDSASLNELFASIEDVYTKTAEGVTGTLQIVSAAASVTRGIMASVNQANIEELERQLEASNAYYDTAYERAEGDQIQQDLIREEQKLKEDELNKEIAKEKTKAAKADKNAAIIQANINTALAITAALPVIPLSILAGVLGAVQIALIASQPIPKFKDGHLSGTHEGLAITNDGGRDEVWERNGNAQVIKGRNVPISMKKGDKIYKSVDDYKQLMKASMLSSVEIDNNKLKAFQAEQSFSKYNDQAIEKAISNGFKKQRVNFHTTTNTKIDIGHELWKMKQIYRS